MSKEGQRELWPPQEWGEVCFSKQNWEWEHYFYLKSFLGGSVLKHYAFLKTTGPPPPPLPSWDIINNQFLIGDNCFY